MEKLPEISEASISKGMWFVWNDGSNIVRVWGSGISGKEKIYLNDTLVSERRMLKTNSEYEFEDSNRNLYGVSINVANLQGKVECQFKKNGEVKKKIVFKYQFGSIFTLKNMVLLLSGFVLIFILAFFLKLTETVVFVLILVLFGLVYSISNKKQYLIEDIDVKL